MQIKQIGSLMALYLDSLEHDRHVTQIFETLWGRLWEYVHSRICDECFGLPPLQTSNLNWFLASAIKVFDTAGSSITVCADTAAAVRRYHVRAGANADFAASALPVLLHLAAIATLCDGSCEGGDFRVEPAAPPMDLLEAMRGESRSRRGDDASVRAIA
jgi:hypothetical protein